MNYPVHVSRNRAPVFVVGCPRSGTTLLYDMLLSAGGFAVYLAESNVFNLLLPRFGDPGVEGNLARLRRVWLQTKLFRAAHIDPAPLETRFIAECHNAGDFLRIFMEEICRAQQVDRWADNSPEEILYLPVIKRLLPNALVVHIIRDGRDVALSLNRQGWISPVLGEHPLIVSGLYWEWIVRKGRAYGKALGADYAEVRFEDLVANPRHTLSELALFLDHPLDYDRIQQVGLGTVSRPNTSFHQESGRHGFNPLGRWRGTLSLAQLERFEECLGNYLRELGYPLATPAKRIPSFSAATRHALYQRYFDAKLRLKNTWLYRGYYRMLDPSVNIAKINYLVMADDVTPPAIPRGTPSTSA